MKILSPTPNASFLIPSTAEWPSIAFQTDGSGAHSWDWKIVWNDLVQHGSCDTPSNQWDAQSFIADLGGTLTVTARCGSDAASCEVKINGTNPSSEEVMQYLQTLPGTSGFDKILQQESRFAHFAKTGSPVKSFDNGYGMCQLTTPTPTYQQIWNWKSNLQAGLALFAAKRTAAIQYLTQQGRTATDDQIRHEAVCRWNGGPYHVWDAARGWIRNPTILCDSLTGNIGWDMTDPANAGKNASQLHQRDKASYNRRPADAHWKYSGVCYADKVLG